MRVPLSSVFHSYHVAISIHPTRHPGTKYFLLIPPQDNIGTFLESDAIERNWCPVKTIPPYTSSPIMGKKYFSATASISSRCCLE